MSEVIDEKNASVILKELLKRERPLYLSSLQDAVKNYHVLKNTVLKLYETGYIKIDEVEYKGKKALLLDLTPRGKIVAEALKQAEWLAKLPPEDIEKFANIRAFIHLNTYADHITIQDVHLGISRIVNVFVKPKGNLVHFYCDYHKSDDCYHIEYLFADTELSNFIRSWIEKNGYRLAKKYEKYVEKYW